MQLPEGSSVEEDDEVIFEGGVNMTTGARKANSVQLASKANEQSTKRELGQVRFACLGHALCFCKLCSALL